MQLVQSVMELLLCHKQEVKECLRSEERQFDTVCNLYHLSTIRTLVMRLNGLRVAEMARNSSSRHQERRVKWARQHLTDHILK